MIKRLVGGFALFAVLCAGTERQSNTLWWTSVALLGAASAADIHSSWGRPELNPILRGPDGRFGTRGVAIKFSVVGTGTFLQWMLLRKHATLSRPIALVNTGLAGWYAGAVIHNSK